MANVFYSTFLNLFLFFPFLRFLTFFKIFPATFFFTSMAMMRYLNNVHGAVEQTVLF